MDTSFIALLAILLASAWASGLNLYALLLVLGIAGATGNLDLPNTLESLESLPVIIFIGFLYVIEFGVDKIPGVDSGWDLLHTFIRIPAGAWLAGAFMGDVLPDWVIPAYMIGGVLALISHSAKSGTRLLINSSPEPFSNWAASISEDILVLMGLWLAFTHPLLFMIMLAGFIALIIWLLPKIIRLLANILATLGRLFRGRSPSVNPALPVPSNTSQHLD